MRFALVLIAAVMGMYDATAGADKASDVARDHYNKGTTLFDLGRYRDAAAEYELAYQAKSDPVLLFNTAQTYRLAGDYDKAITFYRSYLRRSPEAANRAEVETKILELQQAIDQQQHAKEGPPQGTLRPKDNSVGKGPRIPKSVGHSAAMRGRMT